MKSSRFWSREREGYSLIQPLSFLHGTIWKQLTKAHDYNIRYGMQPVKIINQIFHVLLYFPLLTHAQVLTIDHSSHQQIMLHVVSDEGKGYRIEKTSNVSDWKTASDLWAGSKSISIPCKPQVNAFYRLVPFDMPDEDIKIAVIGDSTAADFRYSHGRRGG